MFFYKLAISFLICISFSLSAQKTSLDWQKDEYNNDYYYDPNLKAKIYEINGEKMMIMDEMEIQAKPKFNNQLDRNYYYFLNKKLARVYPLFMVAIEQYQHLQDEIKTMDKSNKRKHIKTKQSELALQYENKLKNLTTSEGKIFAKLMFRATGKTVYEIIKELKGGFNAFIWNIKGNLVDIELKKSYDPHKNRSDKFIISFVGF